MPPAPTEPLEFDVAKIFKKAAISGVSGSSAMVI